MASRYGTPSATDFQEPPVVAELAALFAHLNDVALLAALQGPARRGPRGHSVQGLWRCFIAKYALGLPSTAALLRTLTNNPFVAEACGISWPNGIPSEATFSRFFARLASKPILHRVKAVSRALTAYHKETLPGFGDRIAIDSTTLKAWSNGGKYPKSDRKAGWSVKLGTQGRKQYVYGWKLHLAVDCEHELPVGAHVSAGNVHDSQRATNTLSEMHRAQCFTPRFVIADAGYSSTKLRQAIKGRYHAKPIIKANPTHKAAKEPETAAFRALYSQRQAAERVFSRLKGQRSLNYITVRGRSKVTAHCYLSLIALQATTAIPRHRKPRQWAYRAQETVHSEQLSLPV